MNLVSILLLTILVLIIYQSRHIIVNFHGKKNFPFVFFGKEFWYSRSVAVVLFVFAFDKNGKKYVLANQRGKGTPDFQLKWNVPCGYLDFNESGEEAALRETFEETNVNVPKEKIEFLTVNTSPDENRQNVSIRYKAILDENIEDIKLSDVNSEKNEINDIKWIPIDEIDNYEWAFKHNEILKTLI